MRIFAFYGGSCCRSPFLHALVSERNTEETEEITEGKRTFVGFVRMPSRAGGASLGLWILVGATSYLLAFLSLHQANSESFVIDLVAIGGGPLILAIVKI